MDVAELRRTAREHIDDCTVSNPTICPPQGWLAKTVQSISLASLVEELLLPNSTKDRQQSLEIIVILKAYFCEQKDHSEDSSSRDAAIRIREWVAKAILPSSAFAETSPYSMEEKPAITPDTIAKEHEMSLKGLLILSHLKTFISLYSTEFDVTLYTCLASFSDEKDPWTSSKAWSVAHSIAEDAIDPRSISGLLHAILQERVKPLFAKSRSPAITQQGRKALDPVPTNTTVHTDIDVEAKPWKYRDMFIVTVFRWVLKNLDAISVEANWPLIIPPLLVLIDDPSIQYKTKGCTYLNIFLHSCPSPLLERTGLGEVFENAVMPCLMYLPTLTEEAESLRLLNAAYPALIYLSLVRFSDEKQRDSRTKALDRILRFGILRGYSHAGEHVRIAELLVNQMMNLINEMGITSVKHLKVWYRQFFEKWNIAEASLKHVLPLISANLVAPFATTYPPLLQSSIGALEAIMVNDWPRIKSHRGEILRGLTICWCGIKEEERKSEELGSLQESIERVVRLLTFLLNMNTDIAADYRSLIECDDRLHNLLIA